MSTIKADTMWKEIEQKFDALSRTDPFVNKATVLVKLDACSETDALKMCVVALVESKDELIAELSAALAIAPRRVKTPDGEVLRFDVPDDLVPFSGFNEIRNGPVSQRRSPPPPLNIKSVPVF